MSKNNHRGTENTENHRDSVFLCVLRASVVHFEAPLLQSDCDD
ncbi:MAG: hypothetical protein FD123_3808 [Bacteroidetes bacterium]|nr:MAG: hypothetical protein FD123_3808 [Bacteroidota bacterium]